MPDYDLIRLQEKERRYDEAEAKAERAESVDEIDLDEDEEETTDVWRKLP